jgi:hypothetical protein
LCPSYIAFVLGDERLYIVHEFSFSKTFPSSMLREEPLCRSRINSCHLERTNTRLCCQPNSF